MKKQIANKNHFGLSFIATGKETDGKYFLSETIVPSGDSGPPIHSHSKEDEGFFLKAGRLIFTVDEEDIELKKGEFLNIKKGVEHTWKNDSDEDAELLVIFAPAGIEDMFVELDKNISNIKEIGLRYGTDFDI